jgi:hypothetical protein
MLNNNNPETLIEAMQVIQQENTAHGRQMIGTNSGSALRAQALVRFPHLKNLAGGASVPKLRNQMIPHRAPESEDSNDRNDQIEDLKTQIEEYRARAETAEAELAKIKAGPKSVVEAMEVLAAEGFAPDVTGHRRGSMFQAACFARWPWLANLRGGSLST